MTFQACLRDVQHALQRIKDQSRTSENLANFNAKKQEAEQTVLKTSLERLKQAAHRLDSPIAGLIQKKTEELIQANLDKKYQILENLAKLAAELEEPITPQVKVPGEIRSEITTDLKEAEKCFKSGCYRSTIILCGRILETALHRKYYEATGNDLLEKAPGIGLGSLIAKLSEKGAALPPGLPNQIHLINQARVFSVHTKQETFIPTKDQAQAIMLFTIDALNKIFN